MIILGQTLSDREKEKVLKEAHNFADSLHLSSSKYPVGEPPFPMRTLIGITITLMNNGKRKILLSV